MLDNQTQEEWLNMSILVKNQTFGHQFRPFSDQFSQKGPNSDQVRPIRTKSGNTENPTRWMSINPYPNSPRVPIMRQTPLPPFSPPLPQHNNGELSSRSLPVDPTAVTNANEDKFCGFNSLQCREFSTWPAGPLHKGKCCL